MLYDVVLLRTYVAVYEAQSFTRAARDVNLTQSAVSLQMKRLEDQVGLPLIVRGPHGFNLTEEGEIVLHYARRILALCSEAKERITRDADAVIRIAAPECFHLHQLSELIQTFKAAVPLVKIQIELGDVSDGNASEFDIVIAVAEIEEENGIILSRETRAWVSNKDFKIDLNETLPLALSPPPDRWRDVVLDRLETLEKSWYVVLQSRSISAVLSATRAGLAISILPAFMVTDDLKVVCGLPILPDFKFVLRQNKRATSLSQQLAAEIKNHFCVSKHQLPRWKEKKAVALSRPSLPLTEMPSE